MVGTAKNERRRGYIKSMRGISKGTFVIRSLGFAACVWLGMAGAAFAADTAPSSSTPAASSSSSSTSGSSSNPMCSSVMNTGLSTQLDRQRAFSNDTVRQIYTPPPSLGQVTNSPCASKELQNISNKFANAPSRYMMQATGGLNVLAGPVSGIMNNFFKAEISSINTAASSLPRMLNFQSQASSALGSLMSSLGLGSVFSSELCGLMVDMLLKYVQCAAPIKMPNLGSLTSGLNNLLPNNCAGNALRSTLYAAGRTQSVKTLSQPVSFSGGTFVPGTVQ